MKINTSPDQASTKSITYAKSSDYLNEWNGINTTTITTTTTNDDDNKNLKQR